MKGNPLQKAVPRAEFLKKMAAMEKELKRIAEHVGMNAAPLQWCKRRSNEGDILREFSEGNDAVGVTRGCR